MEYQPQMPVDAQPVAAQPVVAPAPTPVQEAPAAKIPQPETSEEVSPEVKKILDDANSRVQSEMAFFEETMIRAYRNSVANITNLQLNVQKSLQQLQK